MPDNISVSITADATQLRSALAMAQADVRAYGAEVRRTANEIRGAGSDAQAGLRASLNASSAAYNEAQTRVNALGSALAATAPQATEASLRMHALANGMIRVTREIAAGEWERLPVSLSHVALRSHAAEVAIGSLGSSFTIMAGTALAALASVAVGLGDLAIKAIHTANMIAAVGRQAVLLGRDMKAAEAEAASLVARQQQIGTGENTAKAVATSISGLVNVTQQQRQALTDLVPAFSQATGVDAQKATEKLTEAFGKGASGVRELMKEYHLWDVQTGLTQREQLKLAETTGDTTKAAQVGIDALTTRFKEYQDRVEKFRAAGGYGEGVVGPFQLRQGWLTMGPGAARGESPEQAAQRDLIEANDDRGTAVALEEKLAVARKAAASSSGEEQAAAQAAVRNLEAELDRTKTAAQAETFQKYAQQAQDAANKAVMAFQGQHVKSTQIAEAETRAQIDIWKKASKDQELTEQQRTQAAATAARYEAQLVRETSSAKSGAAKSDLSAKLAELSAEQAANKDNFDRVLALEDQKIELLKAAGSKYTAQYYTELKRREDMVRQHTAAVVKLDEQSLNEKKTLMEQAIAQRREELQVEVDLHRMSVQQMLADLRAFTDAQHAEWLKQAEQFKSSLDQNSAEYKKFVATLETTQAKWVTESKRTDVEAAQDAKNQFDEIVGPIKSAFNTAFSGVIQGTQTLQQALGKMGQSIAISYLEKFFDKQIDKIGDVVVAWVTGEATKNAATAAGVATRSATEDSGFFGKILSWIGQQIAAFFGMQTAETTAATAAAGPKAVAAMASALPQITAEAGIAAAAAFADSAMLGPAGLAAAPAAAAAAKAQVLAFAALAQGAWNLPRDMMAQLHAGEMVVPASFAAGMRQSMGGGMTLNYQPRVSGAPSDLASMMRGQAAGLKSYLWNQARNGGLMLPGRG